MYYGWYRAANLRHWASSDSVKTWEKLNHVVFAPALDKGCLQNRQQFYVRSNYSIPLLLTWDHL